MDLNSFLKFEKGKKISYYLEFLFLIIRPRIIRIATITIITIAVIIAPLDVPASSLVSSGAAVGSSGDASAGVSAPGIGSLIDLTVISALLSFMEFRVTNKS